MMNSHFSVCWCDHDEFSRQLASKSGITGEVDATSIASKEALLTTIASALKFPDYFSANWDSFEECLAQPDDLQEGGELTLGIRNARILFKLDEAKTLFSILQDVAGEWSTADQGWKLNVFLEGEADQNAKSVLESVGVAAI